MLKLKTFHRKGALACVFHMSIYVTLKLHAIENTKAGHTMLCA